MSPVRVVLGDDHRAFAEAVAMRLDAEPDISVVGVASSAGEVEDLVKAADPDVVVLDVEFPDGDGIDVARRLATNVVIVTFHDDAATAIAAVRAGVAGFVPKDATTDALTRAVRGAARGEAWIDPRVLRPVLEELVCQATPRGDRDRLGELTARERAVLDCLVQGLDRAATARALYVSVNTVRTHTRNLLTKLGAHSTLEAVALALRSGEYPLQQR